MKTKKIKALTMWGGRNNLYSTYYAGEGIYGNITRTKYVLPADAASVKAMVDQMALAIRDASDDSGPFMLTAEEICRAALSSIGIPSRAPKS